ncbi:MAG: hypothetical protein LBQ32_06300 [Burkholderiaceae bacterium]|jgi:hypothetical protein|nr:hypothetical protein [Burkholderiaceae bacterium]
MTHQESTHNGLMAAARGLNSIAQAIGDLGALTKDGCRYIASSIDSHGEAVSASIDACSDSIDRLTDALESSEGEASRLAVGAAVMEMTADRLRAEGRSDAAQTDKVPGSNQC